MRGGVPVTWPNDRISLYTSGLTPEQSSALEVALPQWEAQGRFTVTTVDLPANANLTISSKGFNNGEDGRALVHYVCLTTCAFDHVDIQLSSAPELTKPLWVTTILHELGHAAGLNHVSRKTQVMYPELDLLSPIAYADGDLAGLQELARIRTS
jgi:predicted Zn-dependent protease